MGTWANAHGPTGPHLLLIGGGQSEKEGEDEGGWPARGSQYDDRWGRFRVGGHPGFRIPIILHAAWTTPALVGIKVKLYGFGSCMFVYMIWLAQAAEAAV